MSCWLAQFSDVPCNGRLRQCHLFPKNLLYRSVSQADFDRLKWDPRVWVWACGGPMGNAGHHGMLDTSRTLRVPRDALPVGLEEFAAEIRMGWWLDREYGLREAVA